MKRLGRILRRLAFAVAFAFVGFVLLDRLFPLPLNEVQYSILVSARDGTPLRAFPDANGVWRYPVTVDQISPRYFDALLTYEDRWYHYHPGVNPLALARATWQMIEHGHVVSGGSTLTMQVARLIDPHSRSVGGKIKQMFRALQLEWHYSKKEILTLYINRAPYGGPLEGVQSASYAYFGKPAAELSHAEAALLAVLPQAPTRLRPDLHPERAQAARDKVLRRMQRFGVWSPRTVRDARQEGVESRLTAHPLHAPLLARRVKGRAANGGRIVTTIDYALQARLEQKMEAYLTRLPDKTSAAILVVDNRDLSARAYLGSADFLDAKRFGHVDMVRAVRSPGSTLKPFLYGLALEAGLIHSESLLVDAPQSFGDYRPANFRESFNGPVSASEALRRSLNVPAVDLLDRYGPARFVARLRNGGLRLRLPDGGDPNLAVILGGTGARLEELVGAYTALARDGIAGRVRFTPDAPRRTRRLMSQGAAWIVRRILEDHRRPTLWGAPLKMAGSRRVAWKTGTSYGYRDAWAVGVTDRYTVGVWVGRPDGTPLPGSYGALTAAPILFDVVDSLPGRSLWAQRAPRPDSVRRVEICWPLGTSRQSQRADLCHEHRRAWVLNGLVPPTLPDRTQSVWHSGRVRYWINPTTGHRVDSRCHTPRRKQKVLARWPTALEPWLTPEQRKRSRLPPRDASCPEEPGGAPSTVHIAGLGRQTVLRRAGSEAPDPSVTLSALGGSGRHFWLVDGEVIATTGARQSFSHRFGEPGEHEITVVDSAGRYDRVEVRVIE